MPVRIESAEFAAVEVTTWTEWCFARLRAPNGVYADVEITGPGDVASLVAAQMVLLNGKSIDSEADVPRLLNLDDHRLNGDLSLATTVSALRTGVSIIQAIEDGISLTEALGGEPADSVPLYANINRGLFATDRTAADFARAAERAVREGFNAVKCAPFDEISPGCDPAEAVRNARTGTRRVAAIRNAIGPDIALMVDCHGRFDVESAVIVAEHLAGLGVSWFEEPVRPNVDPESSAQIASSVPMPVAGGETDYGEELFANLIARHAVKVIMPDVMFCGGAAVAARSGNAAIDAGGEVSLHSPSGPVALLTGGHVTASISGAMPLEHAVHEVDWRADLLTPPERIQEGRLRLTSAPGLGAELDWDLLRRVGTVWC